MRLCDFCWNSTGQPVPAATQISIGFEYEETYDACQSCAMSVKEMLNQPKADEKKSGPGRPRKQSNQ